MKSYKPCFTCRVRNNCFSQRAITEWKNLDDDLIGCTAQQSRSSKIKQIYT